MANEADADFFAPALAAHKDGRYDEAARAYEAGLARRPDDPRGLHYYGVLQLQLGRIDEAAVLLARAVAAAPDAPEIRNKIGRAHV